MNPLVITGIASLLERVLSAVIPDPLARANAITTVLSELGKIDVAQIAVNQEEAKNDSVFVSGWRPFIGWVCGFALFYQYILTPVVLWVSAIAGYPMATPLRLDDVLWELMFGMLGMGGLRTFEKIKGVTTLYK